MIIIGREFTCVRINTSFMFQVMFVWMPLIYADSSVAICLPRDPPPIVVAALFYVLYLCWWYRSARHVVRHIARDVWPSWPQTIRLHVQQSWCVVAVVKSASSVRCSSLVIIRVTTSPRDTPYVNCVSFWPAARWPSLAAQRKRIW